MSEELVSVIMPAYNAEKYIYMSIASVMKQTYQNVELVIVDDASTDNTLKIMYQCANMWPGKIRLSIRKQNGGTGAALNDAIELAGGEYICWLSADDLYCEDMIESEVNYLKNNTEYDAVFSKCAYIDENNRILRVATNEKVAKYLEAGMEGITVRLMAGNFFHGCSVLAKAECFKRGERFNVNYRAAQDYDFWVRMAADYDFGYLDQVNVLSRDHSEQGSKKMNCDVDEIHVFFRLLQREEIMKKLYKKMDAAYTYENIRPFIEARVKRYYGKDEEMEALTEELQSYLDMMENGQIHYEC